MNMGIVNHKIIKNRIGLLNLAEELGDVSKACRIMGYSRDTFYRYKAAKEQGGIEALFDANRRKPNLLNRVDEITEKKVVEYGIEEPAHGQTRASNELRKIGVFISPSGVRSIWLRNGLECFAKRLKALEKHSAESGAVLTESQVQALEKKKVVK
jgi:transposase